MGQLSRGKRHLSKSAIPRGFQKSSLSAGNGLADRLSRYGGGGADAKTFVLMYVLAANPVGAADSRPIVNVTGRQLRGTMLDKAGAAFKDIPYAQPPKFSLIKDLCLVVERGNYR